MCTIVWIYGSSAAGKETFIDQVTNNPTKELLEFLGWKYKKIVPVLESIKYIGQYTNDPIITKREEIISKACELSKQGDIIILIKGQDVDLKNDRLNKLKLELPNAKHKIIFLHTDLATLFQRFKNKSWWCDEYTKDTVREWLLKQLNYLDCLKSFDIISLDSSNSEYKTTEFPPKI